MTERAMPLGTTPPDPSVRTVEQLGSAVMALRELIEVRLDAMDKAQALFEGNLTRVPTEVDKQIAHLHSLVWERLGGMEKSIEALRQLTWEHFASIALQFAGLQLQFDERDTRAEQALHAHAMTLATQIKTIDDALDQVQGELRTRPEAIERRVGQLQALHEEKFKSIQTQFVERDTRTEQTSRDSKVAVDAALQAAKEAVSEQNRASSLSISKSETATTKQIDQQGQLIASATAALNDKIDDLKSRLTLIEGRGSGMAASWGVMVAAFGMIVGIGGLMFAIFTK